VRYSAGSHLSGRAGASLHHRPQSGPPSSWSALFV